MASLLQQSLDPVERHAHRWVNREIGAGLPAVSFGRINGLDDCLLQNFEAKMAHYRLAVALGGALFLASCATTDGTEQAAATSVAESNLECRKEQVTGSRFPVKVCKTPEEWAERAAANDPSDGISRRSLQMNPDGG